MRNSDWPSEAGFQPMPTFCVHPNRSPLGAWRSDSSVSGSRPSGPGVAVIRRYTAGSVGSTRAARLEEAMIAPGQGEPTKAALVYFTTGHLGLRPPFPANRFDSTHSDSILRMVDSRVD